MSGRVLTEDEIQDIERNFEYVVSAISIDLIDTIRDLKAQQKELHRQYMRAVRQNAIMRRELEWFADPDNYAFDYDEDGYHSAPIANGFKRAQRALEGME